MSVSEIMWVEKYRPKKISDIIGQKEIIGSLSGLMKNQVEMPNLLFSGGAGVGTVSNKHLPPHHPSLQVISICHPLFFIFLLFSTNLAHINHKSKHK